MFDFIQLDEKLRSGDLKQTLLEIDSALLKNKENPLLTLKLEFYKGKTLKLLENFEEGLEIFNIVSQKSVKLDDLNLFIDCSLNIAEIQSRKGNMKKAFKTIEIIENKLKHIETLKPLEITRKKVEINNIMSSALWKSGDLKKALEYMTESLKMGDKIGDKSLIGHIYYLYGTILSESGDLIKGLDILQKSLELFNEIKDIIKISKILNNIAWTYKLQGKLDLALDYTKRSINLTKKYKNQRSIRIQLGNLGVMNWQKGNLNEAIHYLNQSLELDKKIGNYLEIMDTLFYLFTISLDQKNLSECQKYLEELKKVDELEGNNKRIHAIYETANALMFKIKPRVKKIYEAQEILKRIINSDVIKFELTVIAMINLCDLYIYELRSNNDEDILNDINEILQKLLLIAENHNSFHLLAEIYLIQAKFALIQLDIQKARTLLTKAQKLADLKGLNRLAMTISEEHDQLLEKYHVWTTLDKSELPFSDKLNLAMINPQMERLLRQGQSENIQIKNETPIAINILKENGSVLFSKAFISGWVVDEQLIGSLISAFQLFSGQLFSESFDRAKFGEYFILIKSISPLLICYIYKGQTYSATQKLNDFSNKINKKDIWEQMQAYSERNEIFSHENISGFNEVLTEVFLS